MNISSVRKVAYHCYLLRVVLCFYVCELLKQLRRRWRKERHKFAYWMWNTAVLHAFHVGVSFVFISWDEMFFRWVHDVSTCQLFNCFLLISKPQTPIFFLDSSCTFVRARRLEMNIYDCRKAKFYFQMMSVSWLLIRFGVGLSKSKTWGGTIFKTHPRVREELH